MTTPIPTQNPDSGQARLAWQIAKAMNDFGMEKKKA
jgi:hypothetical protein